MYPIRLVLLIPTISVGILLGCSSSVKKADIPADANPVTEISRLEQEMSQAKANNVDVASPQNYNKAQKAFEEAKEMSSKDKAPEKILNQVAIAQGALNEANAKAPSTKEQLSDLMQARTDAKTAKADEYYKIQMAEIDRNLKDVTWEYEKGKGHIAQKRREAIQKSYLDLESKSIQKTHLSDVRAMIENAEKNGAKKYAPKSLATAQAKLKNAETVIDNNRHDESQIQTVSQEARAEAKKLMVITQNARKAKGLSPEEVALDLNAKETQLAIANQQIDRREEALQETTSEKNAEIAARDRQIAQGTAALSASQKKEDFNTALADAQKEFSKDEAEVYRQGDSLLIRLKTGTFASGSADLAAPAFTTLNKVNNVVSKIDAEKVVVEGHTDSTGSKEANQKLSEARAKTVANFISSANVIERNQIEAEGMGYEKPVATNKTKEGRAQNRRVDILITPKAIE